MKDKNFTGIGKIILQTPSEMWNIPNLHFIVNKADENLYEAISLEFGLVSIGETGEEAGEHLANLVWNYVLAVIKEGNGYKELRETVRKHFMDDYLAEYRGIEFDLAETGKDLSHSYKRRIKIPLQQPDVGELKKAPERNANETAEEHAFMEYEDTPKPDVKKPDVKQEEGEETVAFLLFFLCEQRKTGAV
jgi:hypothetical protein